MDNVLLYPVGMTPACRYAVQKLRKAGVPSTDHITPEITHILLDVPSFGADGSLRGGGDIHRLLQAVPESVTILGGNLPEWMHSTYVCRDLLRDEGYLAENAAITAQCALGLAAGKMARVFRGTPVLVVGWGRIGKHLAHLLQAAGSLVTICSRSEAHRAEAVSFGMNGASPEELAEEARGFRLVFNTAPEKLADFRFSEDCLKIELASRPGLSGPDIIHAGGLPGRCAPESSGELMAETILRLLEVKES